MTVGVRVGVGEGCPKATVATPSNAREQTTRAIVLIIEAPFAASAHPGVAALPKARKTNDQLAATQSSEGTIQDGCHDDDCGVSASRGARHVSPSEDAVSGGEPTGDPRV